MIGDRENQQFGFLIRPETNQAVQPQKMASSLKFWILEDCTACIAETMALISFLVSTKLVCAFVFAYANCWFSDVAAHIIPEDPTVLL